MANSSTGFHPKEYLKEALESKDIIRIRNSICGYIRSEAHNPELILQAKYYAGEEVKKMKEENLISELLVEKHNGELPTVEGDEGLDDLAEAVVDLMENFSEERFKYTVKLCQAVRDNDYDEIREKTEYERNDRSQDHKTIKPGFIIATVAIATIIIALYLHNKS